MVRALPRCLLVVAFAAGSLAAAGPAAAQGVPSDRTSQGALSPAEREWQEITDELIPKLVAFKALPEAEKKKETFAAELARIEAYVRRFSTVDPWSAANARVFMAAQVLAPALRRDKDAIAILRDVALQCPSSDLAGIAALQAGDLFLKLGDADGLNALRDDYSARESHDPQVATRLTQLCRQVLLQPGRAFPSLPLADLDGKKIDLAALHGKLVTLLVFNLDHAASKRRLEELASWLDERKDPAVAAVGISLDKDRERVRQEAAKLPASFPIDCSGREFEGPAAKELALTTIPVLYVLDPEGRILVGRALPADADLSDLLDDEAKKLRASGALPPRTAR